MAGGVGLEELGVLIEVGEDAVAAVDAAVGVEGVDEALLAAVGGPGFQAVTGFLLGTGVSRDTRGQVVEEGGHGRRSAVGIGYGWVVGMATVDARRWAIGMGFDMGVDSSLA